VTLSLLIGPANAGKVELLLEHYLARIEGEPFLVVPNRSDVDRAERDLLRRSGCLLGGAIGTFDDLFRGIADEDPLRRPVASVAQRELLARRTVAELSRGGAILSPSARFAGFSDALLAVVSELEGGLVEPADLDGELAVLYAAYRAELDRLGLWDRDTLRRRATERLAGDLDAWHGRPVFIYGFEDLTAAQWSLLEALSGRAEVEVSLPYEPGRAAFSSLRRTAEDLAVLAGARIEELPPRSDRYTAPALAHLERTLFEPGEPNDSIGGALRFLAGAGTRGTLELVAEELLALLRSGTPPEQIALVVPSLDGRRAPLESALTSFGIPYAIDARVRFGTTTLGRSLVALLAFAWSGAGRRELYTFLRSPYSGIARPSVDFTEGRLRGRAISEPGRVEEETERLREAPLVALRELRLAPSPVGGARAVLASMLRAAYGLDDPPSADHARLDLRSFRAAIDLLDELSALESLGETLAPEEVIAALERCEIASGRTSEPGRVAVLDLLAARTRRFEVVFVLGLEEGSLPHRGASSPFLDDEQRRMLGSRLERPDPVSRDRYLFYSACTRATRRLYLVREAVSDEGSPREESPFWHAVTEAFTLDQVDRSTRRRTLSELTWPIETAPTERERLRALARLSADPDALELALALAETNGWSRRLGRARDAFRRDARLRNPVILAQLDAKTVFGATELERFVDCSSAWFFERLIDPKTIDAEADALLRGKVAHQTLYAFYAGLPRELGVDRVTPATLDAALGFLARCLDESFGSGVRIELGEVEAAELREGLWRDLDRFVRDEAGSHLAFVPRRFELGFGTDRSAPELQRGLALGEGLFVSGKIDRIDIDPHSARGIVQDYKSGKGSFSARQIDDERRLQVPLYMLVLRDLAGIEPLGGLYRALSGARAARGMLRLEAREELPGFKANDYLDEEQFWAQVETARGRALSAARRIRTGELAHDPRGGECPSWCDLWTMCRVARA
jgi:ATP-dependent helicase/DNAse subunit B